MSFQRYYKVFLVIGLIVILTGLSIAYATLSSKLTVNTSANVITNWKIVWDNIQTGNQTGYAVVGSLSIDSDRDSITGSIGTINGPGDTLTWTWDIKNEGNINAKLTGFTNTALKCSVSTINPAHTATQEEADAACEQLSIEFFYNGVSLNNFSASNYSTLNAGSSLPVSMKLSYSENSSVTISGPIDVAFVNKPLFTFEQASA